MCVCVCVLACVYVCVCRWAGVSETVYVCVCVYACVMPPMREPFCDSCCHHPHTLYCTRELGIALHSMRLLCMNIYMGVMRVSANVRLAVSRSFSDSVNYLLAVPGAPPLLACVDALRHGVDTVNEHLELGRIVRRMHAVSEIGNVALGTEPCQHFLHFGADGCVISIEDARVQVPLQRLVRPNPLSRNRWIDGPVHLDHIICRLRERLQSVVRALGEDDHGYRRQSFRLTPRFDLGGNPRDIWQQKRVEGFGVEFARPGFKHLQNLRPRTHLPHQIRDRYFCDLLQQVFRRRWVCVEPALRLGEHFGAPTLGHVRHDSPRASAEPVDGNFILDRLRSSMSPTHTQICECTECPHIQTQTHPEPQPNLNTHTADKGCQLFTKQNEGRL
eukprot:m.636865 g.636865  ORF g.636865 m.636865 type:complete len:388 (-) comp22600_c0_seq4:520-1683(-)